MTMMLLEDNEDFDKDDDDDEDEDDKSNLSVYEEMTASKTSDQSAASRSSKGKQKIYSSSVSSVSSDTDQILITKPVTTGEFRYSWIHMCWNRTRFV